MNEFVKDFTPLVAILSLAFIGWALLAHGVDGFLILTDIVAIAGLIGCAPGISLFSPASYSTLVLVAKRPITQGGGRPSTLKSGSTAGCFPLIFGWFLAGKERPTPPRCRSAPTP